MKKIGVAVIGLGRIGRVHAEIFMAHVENARLVAVADVVEELARSVGERFGVKWYRDYDALLKDPEVDAVVICTPTFLHAEMIVKAAEAGKHIFCEKPMTVTSDEAKRVISAVERAGVKLMVGYMRRFDEAYLNAKKLIEEGKIGRPIMFISIARDPAPPPGWAADPKLSGGIFLDMLSHDFDMARWLIGSEVKEVYVHGGVYMFPEEIGKKGDLDVVSISFKFENGVLGYIHGTRKNVYGYDLRTEVYGTDGIIYVGARENNLFSYGRPDGLVFLGVKWFEKRFYDAYIAEDRHFIQCIIEDKTPLITGIDGLRAVQIAEACWRSYREGRPVTVSYD